MIIKKLNQNEIKPALELVWRVFLEFEAPDYTDEGVQEFNKSIHDENFLSMLTCYGAFLENELLGVIATRSEGTHIALFFVDKKYQNKGVGRALFNEVKTERMTVNSSPFAVPIYRRLGFVDIDEEQCVSGLRFTPMKYEMN